jgi:hypothetical protein
VLKNPLRRLLRKPTLTRAADDDRNSDHVLVLCRLMRRPLPKAAGSAFVVTMRFPPGIWKAFP